MSKSMTRKGLSFGAGFALVASSLVAAAPAQAAAELILEPNAGTEYGMIEGETFTLKVYGNSEFLSSNGSQIRFKVENDGAASFGTFAINGTALDNDYASTNGNMILFTGATAPASGSPSTASIGTLAAVGTADEDTAVLGLGSNQADLTSASVSAMTVPATLSFTNGVVDAATPEKLKVTAWADADNDGVIDTGEIKSATRTVTFYDAASTAIKPTVTGQPWEGDTTAKFTFDLGVINEAQLAIGDVGLLVLNNASTPATPDKGVTGGVYLTGTTPAVTLNTAKTKFQVTVSNEPATDGTAVAFGLTGDSSKFTAQALFKGAGTPTAAETIGAAAYKLTVSVADRTSNTSNSAANVVTSKDAKITTAGSAGQVRTNSAFGVAFVAKDGSSPAKTLAGIATTATFASSVTLSATQYVTVNGVAYTTDAALAAAEVAGTTSATGVSAVTVQTTGFEEDDTVSVTFTAEGKAYTAVTATMKDAEYSMGFVQGNEASNAGYDPSIAPGGSHSVSVAVVDQWGVAPANSMYYINATRAATTNTAARTTAAAWAVVAPVVDGLATVSIKDNGAGAGSDTVTLTLVGASASSTTVAFDLVYSTTNAAANLTLTDNWVSTEDSTVRLNATAVNSYHPYFTNGASAPTVTDNFKDGATTGTSDATLTLSGTVTNATNLGVEGVPVTLSAKGLTFAFTDGASQVIYSRDSITVPTASGGTYSVKVYSDATGGAATITASTGALSKTTAVTFAAGAANTFTVTTPATSAAGKTADVIVSATDANGNAVEGATVTLSSTGPGYLINTTGTTLADGTFSTKLLLGSNDSGIATIKVTMTIAGVSTTKTATIAVGGAVAAGDAKVNAGSFKGYVAIYAKGYEGKRLSAKVGKDWVVVAALASNFERVVEYTGAGYTISVPIYIDRVLVDTITVTTK